MFVKWKKKATPFPSPWDGFTFLLFFFLFIITTTPEKQEIVESNRLYIYLDNIQS